MNVKYKDAINRALFDSMSNDPSIILFGEDIRVNLYGYTEYLYEEFGEKRVIDIPLSEASIVGMAVGAAMCGIRPIIDLTLSNFLYIAMDQIANIAAKMQYMCNGQYKLPLTLFVTNMQGNGNAAQHSDRLHSLLRVIPGLTIICPATPSAMYYMLKEAIENYNPVICFADRALFWTDEEFEPSNLDYKVIGKTNIIQLGTDITVVNVSGCLQMISNLIPEFDEKNISIELLDVGTIVPLDFDTIEKSVRKTGRALICDTANKSGSVAREIVALLSESGVLTKCPMKIVACEDIPVPFERNLEQEIIVTENKIKRALIDSLNAQKG